MVEPKRSKISLATLSANATTETEETLTNANPIKTSFSTIAGRLGKSIWTNAIPLQNRMEAER